MVVRTALFSTFGAALLAVMFSACSQDEDRLPGERRDIRPGVDSGSGVRNNQAGEPPPLRLETASEIGSWTHSNGSASHFGKHRALAPRLTYAWSVGIGAGNSKRFRISSEPVVVGGRVFTLDAQSLASAFDMTGRRLWKRDLSPNLEDPGEVTGGGLAYGGGTLVATTGFGEVIALDPESGRIRWRHRLDAALSSAPTVDRNRVVVVGRNDKAVGLSLENGRILWQQFGAGDSSGVFGAGSPAMSGRLVILPFSSGAVVAALSENGVSVWNSTVAGGRRGLSRSRIAAISGDPVIGDDMVFVGNHSGSLAALDRNTGLINWQVRDGATGPIWLAGNSVFVVTDQSRLKRLSAADGTGLWSVELPAYDDPDDRAGAFVHFGPVLAGGRLFVAGSDGYLRSFDPRTGRALGSIEIPDGAASRPVVAGGVLFVLSTDGELHAYR
ncbi:MAG: PQQ-binding-like beta-propeller repeat protein [Paracoccaceae bacterium]|nr:PQQ-binding-like beta-propeller repeat protein [Paracoccaceae bacterium]